MPYYTIRCTDGTDRNCTKTLQTFIPIVGLTASQLRQLSNGESIDLTLKQCEQSGIELTKEDRAHLEAGGTISYFVHPSETVCGPCGSDYTYDKNGRCID